MELLTFEWRRAKSIRTTWITSFFVIASVAAFAYLGTLATTDADGNELSLPVADVLLQSVTANPIALVLLASLGAMAFGHEYRYGTIRLTLTAFPGRAGVFFAKLFLSLLIPLAVLAASLVVAYGVLSVSQVSDTPGGVPWTDVLWQVAVYGATFAALAFSFTVITRNHPLGIIGPLLLSILEAALVGLLSERFTWLPQVLPLWSMQSWFVGEDTIRSAAVWGGWMVALLVLGFALLKRRDA
jgi:ABC-2 type transport system permease protein